jgi:orotate phosphoribosyltransferase
MKTFLAQHPTFLQEQLALGGKNKERAALCLEQGFGTL